MEQDHPKNHSKAENQVFETILALLEDVLGKKFNPTLIEIEYPPQSKLGDYAVPCFLLAKKLKKSPPEVSKILAGKISPVGLIKKTVSAGPYLNFFVNQQNFSQLVLTEIAKAKNKYGKAKIGKGRRVMIEYFSPNTNKPLTIGHVRNICLGGSLARLMKFIGYKVIESTLYNDRGIAVAKAMVGYQKWGNEQTPKSAKIKSDHFVGNFYTKFCREEKKDPNLEFEAKQVLRAWENDKEKTKKIWQKLMIWVLKGFKQTLSKLKAGDFNEEYYESEYYTEGKDIIEDALAEGFFKKHEEGYIYADLSSFKMPDKILLRSDGTSLYMTQDIYLASLKNRHRLDRSIYVVGAEQELYFKQLFKILELLEFSGIKNNYHLSYGMVRLPNTRIKSREGLIKGTGADELIDQLENMARAEIKSRYKDLPEKEVKNRTEQIALAALKFYILAVNPKTTMVFDPKKSLAFAGRTGPYLQYVHARISGIFVKAKIKPSANVDFSVLTDELELELVKLLAKFPEIVIESAENFDPSCLANYLYDLAKSFSLFYEKLPVIKAPEEIKKARLLLIYDVKIVLAAGLELLGIEAPENM